MAVSSLQIVLSASLEAIVAVGAKLTITFAVATNVGHPGIVLIT